MTIIKLFCCFVSVANASKTKTDSVVVTHIDQSDLDPLLKRVTDTYILVSRLKLKTDPKRRYKNLQTYKNLNSELEIVSQLTGAQHRDSKSANNDHSDVQKNGRSETVQNFLYAMNSFNFDHGELVLSHVPDKITWHKCYRHIYRLLYRESGHLKSQNSFRSNMYKKCCRIFNKYSH